MQCFQKDPNLRVTARKLLKHAWIAGCRRSDAPVSKAPSNFNQAVEEVKQWNKALKSSETSLRVSNGSEGGGIPSHGGHTSSRHHGNEPHKSNLITAAKGPLSLAKPRPSADAFRSPELAGKLSWVTFSPFPLPYFFTRTLTRYSLDDDNWDNDFATAISPSALQLPHLKPQDNFGGMLSSDKLKAFASTMDHRNHSISSDEDFEGELMTIKGPGQDIFHDFDSQEKTIRPLRRDKSVLSEPSQPQSPAKSSPRKSSHAHKSSHSKSPIKPQLGSSRFELPARPDLVYREQSVEDYSDLFFENDNVFNQRISSLSKKVSDILWILLGEFPLAPRARIHAHGLDASGSCRCSHYHLSEFSRPTLHSFSIPQT